ncbi:MAG: hypothetical protein GXO59_00915 [Dictyoglomi bacterium]|nr:hypothetical protein [Dictyoglomota bacterium]
MKRAWAAIIVLSIIFTSMIFVGCGADRTTMADVVRYYGADGTMGLLFEWTNITTYDDKDLKEISSDMSSLAKGILVYIPSYGLMGTAMNPMALWKNLLIVVDTPSEMSDKDFADKLSTFMNKWFDVKMSVSTDGDKVAITFMDTKLYVYSVGKMKVLTGNSTLKKRSEPPRYLDKVLDSMLSLKGDYRVALFNEDTYGVLAFTGGSTQLMGKFRLGIAVEGGLKKELLPQYAPVPEDKAVVFGAVDGALLDAGYKALQKIAGGFVKPANIPHGMQISTVISDYTGNALSIVTIGGITPEELFDLIGKLEGRRPSVTSVEWDGGITLYKIDGAVSPYKDGIIYGFISKQPTEAVLREFFTDKYKEFAQTYTDLIGRDDIHLIGFVKIDDDMVAKEFKDAVPHKVTIEVYGTDELTLQMTMDKPVDLKKEIYKYIRDFKSLTVASQMKNKVERARSDLVGIGFSVSVFYTKYGHLPKDKQELLSALDNFIKQRVWLNGKPFSDVIVSDTTIYKPEGTDDVILCIPVPQEYIKYAGGQYAVMHLGDFIKTNQLKNPADLVMFLSECR